MRLQRYGVTLETLKSEHLEMVRLWRNQEYVRNNMHFKDVLSRADQQNWFNTMNMETNIYWVISFNDYPIGLIHIKNVDHQTATGEAGIFIGESSYLEMPQPMLAILFMMELAFFSLGINQLKAKIKSGNVRAISFNERLGYQLQPNQTEEFQYYLVDKQAFENATTTLRASAAKMYGLKTGIEVSSKTIGLARQLAEKILGDERFGPYPI